MGPRFSSGGDAELCQPPMMRGQKKEKKNLSAAMIVHAPTVFGNLMMYGGGEGKY